MSGVVACAEPVRFNHRNSEMLRELARHDTSMPIIGYINCLGYLFDGTTLFIRHITKRVLAEPVN